MLFLSCCRPLSSKSGNFSLINPEIVFASRRIVFAGQLFSVWSAEVQKKTARHAQCVRAVCGSGRAYFSRKYPFWRTIKEKRLLLHLPVKRIARCEGVLLRSALTLIWRPRSVTRERYPAVGDDFHAGRFRCVTITRSFVNTASSGRSASTKNQSWVIRVPCVGRTVMSFSPPSQVKSTSEGSAWGDVVRKIIISFVARNHCNARYKRHGREQKLVHLLHIVRIVLYV